MSAPAAISATFCGMRTVASRKVAQITMEVPIEHMATVLGVLGPPSGVDPQWVAIALLDKKAVAQAQGAQAPVNTKPSGRKFLELPYSQQAALKGEDLAFRNFLAQAIDPRIIDPAHYDAKDAADTIRRYCGIESRSELDRSEAAASKWRAILGQFDLWMRDL